MLELHTIDCEGRLLPTVALKNYFLNDKNDRTKSCNTCGNRSDQNQYRKEVVQLPDTLLMSFAPPQFKTNTSSQVERAEFFIENHLDMSKFTSSRMICYPLYTRYQLKSIIVYTGNNEASRHYYTFAKYNEQFFRCNDASIEPVDKSIVFERKHSTSIAMYIREQNNNCNFADIISQILFEATNVNLTVPVDNAHVRMMFDAALEFVSRNTKLLSWSYGASYTCFECKESEFQQLFSYISDDIMTYL
ncbi:unnamed protein product [Rotaria sp. Silwood1]|nr:unnamed protein product [Rotaria sp. Silwood1]CAF1682525.1 unnamed protein product [Rotaria sp. Silwood1]CAF3847471.1 unnamed protein product [Rotaria sp. Silwood1]CAF5002933.1 unnamed protein product [Rotaria sp. Silwood1]